MATLPLGTLKANCSLQSVLRPFWVTAEAVQLLLFKEVFYAHTVCYTEGGSSIARSSNTEQWQKVIGGKRWCLVVANIGFP